ncbi:hypothetical protein SAY87_029196 [Trapa incisa]|uniref:PPPDE domain-containing protein n=2 Tax=Trapa TaxID=22665 RepID=A0AAN7M793_TRANT|nr:hypothetical protein SAY87_029196 [Trapa incisa]KAK4790765.1 hypothetical protein SAY86_018069 [Trapa natans]
MGADDGVEVVLNVYDLTDTNNYTYWFGFGIFHSGIEVHSKEYGFGAHEYPASGVFEVEPKSCPGFIYRCSISLGRINMSPTEFQTFIEDMASEFHGDTYHLITKNCNHFTDDLSRRLTGKGIPGWVNRLAGIGAACSCLLPESLQITKVKPSAVHPDNSEDGECDYFSAAPQGSTDMVEDANPKQHLLSSSSANTGVAFVKESRV